ncbi:DUF5999 family protein [Streptomyces microflavus]|uniref:DUF5999 family protein n=1 Tax=Streptomyces microflavus TaxID=1919 RepID=UPI002E368299|nr:DUF5999 family protein [Streptomyces microflavus]WTF67160.1 DUF5999 family protein [Streptomyces microflavus]
MCMHNPPCPNAEAADREAAKVALRDDVTGFARLCNGVIRFEDTGEILPDNTIIAPHRSGHVRQAAAS